MNLPITMVTGIGFCGRKGKRKRERQIKEICEHPEKYHFYPPLKKKYYKISFTHKEE